MEEFNGYQKRLLWPLSMHALSIVGGGWRHSSMFSFEGGKQLERLASCQPAALDSVLNRPCSAHHRRTTAYQDTEVTRDMSPD